jgi:hypothetical protein
MGSFLLTGTALAIAITIYWLVHGRAVTLSQAYSGGLFYFIGFGGVWSIVNSLVLTRVTVIDVLGFTKFGYPMWSVPFSIALGVIGYGVYRFSRWRLRRLLSDQH